MAEMFGTPIGQRAYEQDRRDDIRVGVGALEALGRIAMQPDEARLIRAKAAQAEQQTREEELWQGLMKTVAGQQAQQPDLAGPPRPGMTSVEVSQDPIQQLNQVAQKALDVGLVDRATKVLSAATLMQQRKESAETHQANQALAVSRMLRDTAQLQAQYFGAATDPASWDQAGQMWTAQTGRPNPFAGVPYDPEFVAGLNERALTAKERFDLEERQLNRERQELHQRERRKQHDETTRLQAERNRIAQDRENRLAREGGGAKRVIPAPTEAQMREVERELKKQVPGLGAEDAKSAASAIASSARAIMSRNRGITDWRTAYMQALNEEIAAGSFPENYVDIAGYRVPGTTSSRFLGGRVPETAMRLPMTITGRVDAESLHKGRYYINKQGQVAKWDGQQMIPVAR